jgi:hypothetical protein
MAHKTMAHKRKTSMTKVDAAAFEALVDSVRNDASLEVRIAALEAATCLPLDAEAWHECARLAWQLIRDTRPGSPARHRLLELTAHIPVRSLHAQVRRLAAEDAAAGRDALAAANEAITISPVAPLPQGAERPAPAVAEEARPRTGFAPVPQGDPPPPDEARRVNACILHAGSARRTFVAGADNIVRCWIGLPDPERAAVAEAAIPPLAIPAEGLELTAVLSCNGVSLQRKLVLPPDRSLPSNGCDFPLAVAADERYLAVELLFLHRGRVFEAVKLEAEVLTAGELEADHHDLLRLRVLASRRQTIELVDSPPVDALIVCGEGGMQVVGDNAVRRYDLSEADRAIDWLNENLFLTEAALVRRRAAAGDSATEALDADDRTVLALLRTMARHGATLHRLLVLQGFRDPGERIQILNLEPDTYAPLEFVYDRGFPADDAPLCAAGLAALHSDQAHCPHCSGPIADEARSAMPLICPFGFWSIRKIIERLDPDEVADPSLPRTGRRSLPALDAVAFASSNLVPDEERRLTWEALQRFFARATLANDWQEWKAAMREHPPLLVILPHHGEEAALDYLQIGDEALPPALGRLSRGQIDDQYLNPDHREPGPIVLLLGCRTAADTGIGYVQLTRYLQQHKTAIVLGTLAEVLGRHAAPLARELTAQLAAIDDPQADFGTVMRRVRRRMLARGYLMALCLVALGDAEWRLTPRSAAVLRPATEDA